MEWMFQFSRGCSTWENRVLLNDPLSKSQLQLHVKASVFDDLITEWWIWRMSSSCQSTMIEMGSFYCCYPWRAGVGRAGLFPHRQEVVLVSDENMMLGCVGRSHWNLSSLTCWLKPASVDRLCPVLAPGWLVLQKQTISWILNGATMSLVTGAGGNAVLKKQDYGGYIWLTVEGLWFALQMYCRYI